MEVNNQTQFCPDCPNACAVKGAITERVSKQLAVAFVTDLKTDKTFEAGATFKDAAGNESALFLPVVTIESIAKCISPNYKRNWLLQKIPGACGAATIARLHYDKLNKANEADRKAYEEAHPPRYLNSEEVAAMIKSIENGTFKPEDWVN